MARAASAAASAALVVIAFAALPPVARAYTCTGFDPVYAPRAKKGYPNAPPADLHDADVSAADGAARQLHSHSHAHTHHDHRHTHLSAPADSVIAVRPFRLDKMTLDPSGLLASYRSVNEVYLAWLEPDRFLANFRNASGLPTNGFQPYGGWDAGDCLLRGHMAGHYMTALAMMWNATGNSTWQTRAQYMVAELGKVQEANKDIQPGFGYLSGFPVQQFDDLEALVPYPKQWSPYYTIELIMAGLLDIYTLVGVDQALDLALNMASYFRLRIENVIAQGTVALWHAIMNQEFGGMNRVLYDLCAVTGNATICDTAHLFDKPCFLGPLALGADQLDGQHANAHIPIAIGAARHYEVEGTGSELYADIAQTFHDQLVTSHSFSTGNGNSGEYLGAPGRMGDQIGPDTHEQCTSHNQLILDVHVLGWTRNVSFSDHYERLYFNGILGTMNLNEMGGFIYMLPLPTVNGSAKSFSDPEFTMTCCMGTGITNFAKVGDTLYFHEDTSSPAPTLYVSQYHSSTILWDTVGTPAWPSPSSSLTLAQSALWDDAYVNPATGAPGRLQSNLTISAASGAGLSATLALRVPSWADLAHSTVTLNGQPAGVTLDPAAWATVTRTWSAGDVVTATFAFSPVRIEAINDDRAEWSSTASVMTGPFVLVAPTQVGSALYGDPTALSTWIQPLDASTRAASVSLAAGGAGAPSAFVRHDSAFPTPMGLRVDANLDPTQGTNGPDSTFVLRTPGLTGEAGTASVEASAYPGFFFCYGGQGDTSPIVLANTLNTTAAAFNASCTFTLQSPGLTGAPGSVSLAIPSLPNAFVSWYGGGAAVTAQTQQAGNPSYANMTTWLPSAAGQQNWPFPPFTFVARGSAASKASGLPGARDYLLYPILSAVEENYVAYFQVAEGQ